ncbi:Alpha/Beta hydrolase protein [Aspergillus bertholletiae]|uniref:Alpha/Beta hydrolase protein n=1 Tax=Aspergillus bertholletiae TaxID=1226010 RepID=A0A5N7BB60_9EURO|nr:Alpha/Beta hydrolase protein [Aspergillus bertholletiae]
MESFELSLPNGGVVSGLYNFPPQPTTTKSALPLIVCVPGGSYDAHYFDANPEHSILAVSQKVDIPVISINRPCYGASTPAPPSTSGLTYAQAQGEYLDKVVFPALWKEFATKSGATHMVLIGHSIGAMMITIVAGVHEESSNYPLAGLITSGIGTELAEGPRGVMIHLLNETSDLVHFDIAAKDAIMFQWPHQALIDENMCRYTERLNQPVPAGELHDINMNWLNYWRQYSEKVKVPLMYGLSEFDGLWTSGQHIVDDYRAAFSASPLVNSQIIPHAPHCIELSLQSKAWYLKCCGFALECVRQPR